MTPSELTTQSITQANRYLFSTAGTRIVFFPLAPGSVQAGKYSRLDYQGPEGLFTFQGSNLQQQQTPLGLLITVILQPDFDAGELSLTLVLPPVNLASQKQQDFATIAIKARSKGFVVDRSGAQLSYEVLQLKGVAQAITLPIYQKQPDSEPKATILEITRLDLLVLERFPLQLRVTVAGTVSSAGWSNPQLVPYVYVQAPPDGIYDFEFVAIPPKGTAAQVVTPIQLTAVIPLQGMKGIRVHAANNVKVALIDNPDAPSDEETQA